MAKSEVSTQQSGTQDALASEEYVVKTMPYILGTFDMTATYAVAISLINNAATTASGGIVAYILEESGSMPDWNCP